MPQIIPIKDLKNTSEISDMCHKTKEPIYVTKNGYGDMVIMSMESYETMLGKFNLYRSRSGKRCQSCTGIAKIFKCAPVSIKSGIGHSERFLPIRL